MSKLDEFKNKFSGLLKKSPFNKNKDNSDEFEGDTGEFTSSDLDELKEDATELTDVTDIEIDEDEKSLKSKLNKQIIIRVVLVLVVIGLAADYFLNMEDPGEKALAELEKKKPKRKRKRKNKKKPKTKNEAEKSITNEAVNSEDVAKGIENLKKGKVATVDTDPNETIEKDALRNKENDNQKVNVTDNTQDSNNEASKDASGIPPETPAELLEIDSLEKELKALDNTDKNKKENEAAVVSGSAKNDTNLMNEVEKVVDEKMPTELSSDISLGQNQADKKIDNNKQAIDQKSKSLEDKMLETIKKAKKKEYVSPPDYEKLGRGLVYNCRDQYWSCVNKKAFFQCRDNFAWTKANEKPAECAIKNVYGNVKDCQKVQQYYVDNAMTVDACSD